MPQRLAPATVSRKHKPDGSENQWGKGSYIIIATKPIKLQAESLKSDSKPKSDLR